MEKELANLRLDEEEEEGVQFELEGQPQTLMYDLCLVNCCLTASVVNFPTLKNVMANLWHPLGGIQISDLGEKRLCRKRINLRLGEVEYGWDITLRAKPMRAVVTPSVWIREEPMERNFGNVSSNGRKEQNEVGTNGKEEKDDMEEDNEEIPIKNNEGKKLHRSNIQASPSYTYKGIKGQANGTRGGLSLSWRSELSGTLKSFSNNHIDVSIEKKEVGAIWRLTGFYGAHKARGRSEDGLPRDQGRMEEFQSVLSECQLKDVGYVGRWFTWERGLKELVEEGKDSDLRLGGPWRRLVRRKLNSYGRAAKGE
ncbi:hypothetical protein Goarm_021271 [Gossypium armourianum]|uniref:DUF4283 domain-containing protein n=1 Tax=Gossypium armourianum TaxID=34283 RepID=A0A7J9ITX4_9ROSI|nr:hypothetical protein [Gossypium armourianum]